MLGEDDFAAWSRLDAEALGADGYTAIGAHFDVGAQAPDKGPPGTVGYRAQHRALFFEREVPGLLGFHFEFPMDFLPVAMEAQRLDMRVGLVEVGNVFAGEVGRQALLPEEVAAFDFSFGLRGWGITEGDAIEMQRPAQLGQRVWGVGEEEAVVIHIEFQRQPPFDEGRRQQIKVGQQVFRLVEFGAGEDARAIIQHVDHWEGLAAVGEPGMGRGVQLAEFADLAALPAPHGRQRAVIGFGMGELVLNCPATDLSPVELEVAFAMRLAGSEAVGSRGVAAEPFAQKRLHFGGPVGRMVATRNPRGPGGLLMPGAGLKVIAIDFIEASPPQADPLGGRARFEFAGTKQGQNVTDERTGTAMGQLSFSIFHPASLAELEDAVPQTPWDFPLCGLKRQGHAGLGVHVSLVGFVKEFV